MGAPTAVFSLSDRLSNAYGTPSMYNKHVNSSFNHGTRLADPQRLLQGTRTSIRHVPVATSASYRAAPVAALVPVVRRISTGDS